MFEMQEIPSPQDAVRGKSGRWPWDARTFFMEILQWKKPLIMSNIAMENGWTWTIYSYFPMKDGDFPYFFVCFPGRGNYLMRRNQRKLYEFFGSDHVFFLHAAYWGLDHEIGWTFVIQNCDVLYWLMFTPRTTVDGRNPAPVDRWFIPLFIGFQPSKVVQDFFHPQ